MSIEKIRKRAERKFPEYLVATIDQQVDPLFPLEIPFPKLKASAPLTELERWIRELKAHSKATKGHGYELEISQYKSRTNNIQSLPSKLFFPTEDDFLRFIGKQKEARLFRDQFAMVIEQVPALHSWIRQKPLQFLKHIGKWEDLVKVLLYYLENPRPRCYPRELPIEVHSKFVESHKGLIEQLLTIVMPVGLMDWEKANWFERLSLKRPPNWVRLRFLDPKMAKSFGFPCLEVALPRYNLEAFSSEISGNVIVIENQVNFLTFPAIANGLAIWGKGYSVHDLDWDWLRNTKLWYWGDLDTHGFDILSIFRGIYPNARSLLMDSTTYEHFKHFTVEGTPFKGDAPKNLTVEELELFHTLNHSNLRLEQEHISQSWVLKTSEHLLM